MPSELTRLTDAASQRCRGQAVAVVRGFDRASRQRATTLRTELTGRGVPTIDVGPVTAGLRRCSDGGADLHARHVGLVLDSGVVDGQAQRLAAELGVPVLRLKAKAAPARRSALGVFEDTTMLGVALHDVIAVPADAREGQLAIAEGDDPECLVTGIVRLVLDHPQVGRADRITVTTSHSLACVGPVRLTPHRGLWTLHIDGTASSRPLGAPVEVRCLVDRIEQLTA